jgi:MFS family permease
MHRELGWAQSYLTGAFSLAVLVSAFVAVPVGRALDRHGARALMTLGSVGAALLVLAWASVESVAGFYAVWIGLGVVMATVLYEPAFAVVATWFDRDRTKAMMLLTLAGGMASPIFVPLTAWLAGAWGWRAALVVLAGVLAAVTVPIHALVLRRRPSDLGLRPAARDGEEDRNQTADAGHRAADARSRALRSVGFRWLTVSFWLLTFAAMAVAVHMIPLLLDRGLGAGTAVTAAALVGGMQIPGRILIGPLERRVSPRAVALLVFLLQTLGLVALATARGATGVFVFAVLFGVGAGAATLVRATVVARLYGVENYGSISGVLALFTTSARALAPIAVSLGCGLAGGYQAVLWALVAMSLAAVVAMVFVERPVSR